MGGASLGAMYAGGEYSALLVFIPVPPDITGGTPQWVQPMTRRLDPPNRRVQPPSRRI